MMRRNFLLFVLTLAAAGVTGCGEITNPGEGGIDAKLTVRVDVATLAIATMSVTVSAADITTPLIFNLQVANGIAQGTITVRPGSARKFTARAFDLEGIETHFGETSMDVRIAGNPTVRLVLVPHAGGVPIMVVLGGVLVTVTPSSASVRLGETLQLLATVTNGDGDAIDLPVTWATSNPGLAAVNESGLVTGLLPGEVQIVATAGGEAGAAAIVIPPLASVSAAAGSAHKCGFHPESIAYCRGSDQDGQLADGSTANRITPVRVRES